MAEERLKSWHNTVKKSWSRWLVKIYYSTTISRSWVTLLPTTAQLRFSKFLPSNRERDVTRNIEISIPWQMARKALRFSWRVSIVMLSKCEIYCKWKARVFTVTAARTIRGYLKILSIHDSRAIEIKFTLGWFSAGGNCAKRQLEGPVRFITISIYDSLVESWSI